MWTNSLLKQNAWNSVKNYYWPALGVTFVAGILGANGGGGGYSGGSSSYSNSLSNSGSGSGSDSDMDPGAVIAIIMICLVVFVFAMAFALALQAFLGNIVRVGECKYFYDARNGDQAFGKLFDNFRNGKYLATVKVMFFRSLYIMLWSLLFYIPGIIKAYEYFLIPYLLAENPFLSKDRAFEISKKTMDGEKWNLFVLQLSFIGWFLLGLLACVVGIYFVQPYYEATMAEFYTCMRAKMLSMGIATEEELGGTGFGNTTYENPGFNGGNNFGTTTDPYNTQANPYGAQATPADPYGAPAAPADPYGAPSGDMPGVTQDAMGNPIGENGFPDPAAPTQDNRVSLDKTDNNTENQ
ncbi:MAG: DUF975 family protein [Oscillospiraceae bacterium]|nr:DUF975 family protein [Oscillospiraceae bacterium]